MPSPESLNPLSSLCRKYLALEAQVIWAEGSDWQPQEDDEAGLDGEEIAFYAEGMLMEGYSCAWQILGVGAPEFVRLFFWIGEMPHLPDDPDLISQGSTAG
jgi:hypothetical protein